MRFLLKRALTYVVIFLVGVNLDFILPRLAPGNAVDSLITGGINSQNEIALLTQTFGLNQPILTQYYLYLKNIFVTFPPYFGLSFQYYPSTATSIILERIPASALLIAMSFLLGAVLATTMSMIGALRRRGKFEIGALWTSVLFLSIPAFWIGLILVWEFAIQLRWFPAYGISNPQATGVPYFLSILWHLVLPVVTLTLGIFGHWYLLIRSSTLRVLKSDYVAAARLRGLGERIIAIRYVLRNSLIPIVSVASYSIAVLVSLNILVETVFGYYGVGDLFGDAIFHRDYPILEGALFWLMLIVIAGGLLGDLVLTRIDPRLRTPNM